MSTYPIEPGKLLEVADILAPDRVPPGRPQYAAHRRAVSTAYYAVFHAIGERVAAQSFPSAGPVFRQRVRRWITHNDVKTVARWVSQLRGTAGGSPPTHIQALFSPASGGIDAGTALIAAGFLELNDKREQADYDHQAVFPRADTLELIALARLMVKLVEDARSSGSSHFFGLIAMQTNVKAR